MPAYRSTVFKAVDQARASLFPPAWGRFGRTRNSSPLSVLFAMLQQLRHGGLRITGHPCADAFQKAIVPNPPARYGMIVGVPRRFRDAGQQRLYQRIDESEQRLLA